jgi:hypothetical protein
MMKLGKWGGLVLSGGTPPAPSRMGASVPAPWVPPGPKPWVPPDPSMPREDRPRLLFAIDATGSRATTLEAARDLTDALVRGVPGSLDVGLAVHGGGEVHTFTADFTPDTGELRAIAAKIKCRVGGTRLLDILKRVLKLRVAVVAYIGDAFEESDAQARKIADALCRRQTRVIILHEGPPPEAFSIIAERSGGALLPFDVSALDKMGNLLEAAGILASGGEVALAAEATTKPEARLLLEHLSDRKLIGRSTTS